MYILSVKRFNFAAEDQWHFREASPLKSMQFASPSLKKGWRGGIFFIDGEISEDLKRDCLYGKARLKSFQKFLPA
jgi:hypothetical protein